MVKTYNFSIALLKLKHGHKVKREGWNGKEQYIELGSNVSFKQPDGEIINSNHLDMGNKVIVFHGTSGIQVGWLASQADMLAEDWVDVDELAYWKTERTWEHDGELYCSQCGFAPYNEKDALNYCPNCGAKMGYKDETNRPNRD